MKILITGANGQLGRDIQNQCQERSVGYTACGSGDLDISDGVAVRNFFNNGHFDCIINCAAYNAVDRAETEWRTAFGVNGLGVRNLSIAANRINAIFVHFSTDYVFDGKKDRPYTIVDSPSPVSRYGESKLLGEQYTRDLAERFLLIRTSWVFGKGNDNFAKKVIQRSREKDEIRMVDDQTSSPTYTVDLAHATLDLVEKAQWGTYHVTNAGFCTRYEWAEYILATIGWGGRLIRSASDEFRTPATRPTFSVLDNFGTPETTGYVLPDWRNATTRFLKESGIIS
jgi:dTDP-4-dehydrorhamnose reductase